MEFAVDADSATIEKLALESEQTKKYLEGFTVVKVIVVPKRIVNIVLKK